MSKNKKSLTGYFHYGVGTCLLAMVPSSAYAENAGAKAANVTSNVVLITAMILAIAAMVGAAFVIAGILGLMKAKNQGGQESAGDHWKKVIGGSALFGIPAIVLIVMATASIDVDTATQSNVFGSSS